MLLNKTSTSKYLFANANSNEALAIKNKLSLKDKVELDENGKPKIVNGKFQWNAEYTKELRASANNSATNFIMANVSFGSFNNRNIVNFTNLAGKNVWSSQGSQYPFSNSNSMLERNNGAYYTGSDYLQLNALAESTKLKTAIGSAEVFLDMLGDNDSLGVGDVGKLGNLFNFDSNNDGFLDKEDELFSKLKLRVDNGNGEYRIANLSDVVSRIDLYDFIKGYDKSIGYDGLTLAQIKEYRANFHFSKIPDDKKLNPYVDIRAFRGQEMSLFPPEQHYKEIDKKDIRDMFEAYADKEGWVNLKDKEVNEALFASGDFITNFAYKKTNLAGVEVLEEFKVVDRLDNGSRPSSFYDGLNIREFEEKYNRLHNKSKPSYEEQYKEAFTKLYDEYYEAKNSFMGAKENLLNNELVDGEIKEKVESLEESSQMSAIRQKFHSIVGIEFSEERLENIKNALEDPILSKEVAAAMKDAEAVTSMRLEKDGRILLRFESGREILVNELYNETGELYITKRGDRAGISLEARSKSDEELSKIDFSEYGIRQGEEIVSLQNIGAEMVRRLTSENGKFLGFIIQLTGQKQEMVVENLYNLYTIDHLNKTQSFTLEA